MWSLACLRVLLALAHFHAPVSPPHMHVSISFLHFALIAHLGSIMGVASQSYRLGIRFPVHNCVTLHTRLNAAVISSPSSGIGTRGVTRMTHRLLSTHELEPHFQAPL